MNPNDFASLLEREPPQRMSERERCVHELEEYGYPNAARLLRSGPDSMDEKIAPLPAQAADHPDVGRLRSRLSDEQVRNARLYNDLQASMDRELALKNEARQLLDAANERIKKLEAKIEAAIWAGNLAVAGEGRWKLRAEKMLEALKTRPQTGPGSKDPYDGFCP